MEVNSNLMEVTSSFTDEECAPIVTPDSDCDELSFVPETDPDLLARVNAHLHPKEVVSEALRCIEASRKVAGNPREQARRHPSDHRVHAINNTKGRQHHRPRRVNETHGRRRHNIIAGVIEEDDGDDGLPLARENTEIFGRDDDSNEPLPQRRRLRQGHHDYEAGNVRGLPPSPAMMPIEDGMDGNLDIGPSRNHARGRFDDGYSSGSDDEPELRLRLPILNVPSRPARKNKRVKKREAYVPTTIEGRAMMRKQKGRRRAMREKAREARRHERMVEEFGKELEREEEEEKKKWLMKRHGCCEPLYYM